MEVSIELTMSPLQDDFENHIINFIKVIYFCFLLRLFRIEFQEFSSKAGVLVAEVHPGSDNFTRIAISHLECICVLNNADFEENSRNSHRKQGYW
jgi:hypothetical protein